MFKNVFKIYTSVCVYYSVNIYTINEQTNINFFKILLFYIDKNNINSNIFIVYF